MSVTGGRLRLLLASSSVAALLIGGGAPSAFAACAKNFNNTSTTEITNSASINCISVTNTDVSATGGISIVNQAAGTITAGATAGTKTGILVSGGSLAGAIVNRGSISAISGDGIKLNSTTIGAGGITNSGTLSSGHTDIFITAVTNFAGGISNVGTLTGVDGIVIGGGSTISGGINDTGSILASSIGISIDSSSKLVGGTNFDIHVVGATFTGGITNAGLITGGGRGIYVGTGTGGGRFVSTFSGGIANSGTIEGASTLGSIVVGNMGTFLGGITNSAGGTITAVSAQAIKIANVASFGGGIVNAGLLSASNGTAIAIGATSGGAGVATFAGGISNSGTITAAFDGINVAKFTTFLGGITNAGTIMSGKTGLIVFSASTFDAGITNTGLIAAGAVGIEVANISTFSGGITNSGTLSDTGRGIVVNAISTFSNGIINAGIIDATTNNAGIVVSNVSTFLGGIVNSAGGQISVQTAAAIKVAGISTFGGGVTNSGTLSAKTGLYITGVSTFSGGVSNAGTITGTYGIFASNIGVFGAIGSGGITNSGKITSSRDGIYVGTSASNPGVATFAGGISNAGTISAGIHAIAIEGVTSFIGGIANSGLILSPNATGLYVLDVTTFQNTISNGGTISAAFGIGVSHVAVFTGGAGGGITNSGTISAGLTGIYVDSVSTFTGGITNSGTIKAGNVGILVGATTGSNAGISTFGGGITNAGTISAAIGILVGHTADATGGVSTFTGNVSNAGTITASTGIRIAGSTISGAIVVSGNVLASGIGISIDSASRISTATSAIKITGPTFTGGISNAGTVTANNSAVAIYGVTIFSGGISNAGLITASNAIAVDINSDATFGGGIANSGTIAAHLSAIDINSLSSFGGGISNNGLISSSNGTGIQINTITRFSNGITNSGTISAANAAGIKLATITTFAGNLSNFGTITAKTGVDILAGVTFGGGAAIVNSGTISGSAAAIDVSNASSAVIIDQSAGLISGVIKLSANADQLNISGGTIAGNVIGSGSLDEINFNIGAGNTFTYSSNFTGIDQAAINSGTVVLNGANTATLVDVFSGGTLAGTGSIGTTATVTIQAGGTLAPGPAGGIGTLNITGTLVFASAAEYLEHVNAAGAASNTVVTGTATLGGASVQIASGSTIGTGRYTILTDTGGGIGGANIFDPNVTYGIYRGTLSYDADDVYLTFTLESLLSLLPPGAPQNVVNVANGIDNFIGGGGTLPGQFSNLLNLSGVQLENALAALEGQNATGAQTSTFTLMSEFLELMLSQGGGGGGQGSGLGFAPDQQADALPPDIALAYDSILKAPPKQSFDQRWSSWASGFGGASFLAGNAAVGSNNVNASTYGSAAGMEYRPDPNTRLGFALAGSGLNWGLAQNLGTGRSDAFQAGIYAKSDFGPAYVSGALAFGNNWFTTNRIAVGDQLQARFTGQSYAIRGEAGYRYAVPLQYAVVGITPYAAVQTQWFHTPAYSEADLTGGGFGLTFNSTTANDTRSEIGTRFDDMTAWANKPLLLRTSLAWAHDWESGTTLNAAFESLPGSAFTVNGAPLPKDSALTTASAQYFFTPDWSFTAKFDGEFAPGGQTYAGSGTLKYTW